VEPTGSDCGDKDRCTFFEKPGGDGIGIRLLVGWGILKESYKFQIQRQE